MSFSKSYLYIRDNNISLSVYFSSQACKLLELSAVFRRLAILRVQRSVIRHISENPLGLF